MIVFARAPCIALLAAGDERPRHFTCPPGVSKLACPLRVGHGMHVALVRDGVVVARCQPREYRFQAEPETYNFNVYVAASDNLAEEDPHQRSTTSPRDMIIPEAIKDGRS